MAALLAKLNESSAILGSDVDEPSDSDASSMDADSDGESLKTEALRELDEMLNELGEILPMANSRALRPWRSVLAAQTQRAKQLRSEITDSKDTSGNQAKKLVADLAQQNEDAVREALSKINSFE